MSATKEILRFDAWQKRIFRLVRKSEGLIRMRQLDYSTPSKAGQRWPIYLLEVGKKSAFKRHAPLITSGVHGLETIGIRIHLDILRCLIDPKNRFYSEALTEGKLGIYSIPILNPAGVARQTRSNARGIDLNRNSGVEAEKAIPFFGGHRLSPALPYFRGYTKERETRALFRFLEADFLKRKKRIHLALDIHSGYGSENFLWWPYSSRAQPAFQQHAFEAVAARLKANHPLYRIEPMALSYQTHGDLWDFALLEFEKKKRQKSLFLPFTLEIGTWQELRKNPGRMLSKRHIFNPPREGRKAYLKAHRQMLWDFLHLHVQKGERKRLISTAKAVDSEKSILEAVKVKGRKLIGDGDRY